MTEPCEPHNRLIVSILIACALSALAPGVAVAQDASKDYPACIKQTSAGDLRAAKVAHATASEYSDRADYDKAIQYWREAYALDCTAHPELINIANAYEKKGDKAAAVLALETYQRRIGKPDTDIAERIGKLKALTPSAVVTPAPPSTQDPGPPAASRVVAPLATPVATRDSTTETTGNRPFGAVPWIVIGTGGAMAIAGAIMIPLGLGAVSDAKSACGGYLCHDTSETAKGNTGRTEIGVGVALIGVGFAAVSSGLAWQFIGNKPRPGNSARTFPHNVEIAPLVDPYNSGVSFSGSF